MRIISIIVTNVNEGTILSADSFGVFEEQLSNDVVSEAENFFIDKCIENKFGEETNSTRDDLNERNFYREDVSEQLEDGYVLVGKVVVSIVWTYVFKNEMYLKHVNGTA